MASGVLPSLAVAPLGGAAALPDCLEDLHLELDRALQLNTELLSQGAALRRGERSNIDEQIRSLGLRIGDINLNIKACIEANEAKAATYIQAAFRGYLCQMDYLRLLDLEVVRAAARLQGAVRSFLVRRHLALVPVDRDLCPLDLENFFAYSIDGDSIDVVYCYRDLYNKCKMVMPTKDHPVGLEPSSHGKSAKGFLLPPPSNCVPAPGLTRRGARATHASDPTTRSTAPTPSLGVHSCSSYVTAPTPTTHSTTGPPSGDKEKKKRKKGQESAKGKVRAAAQKQRDKKARLSFAVARRERLGPFAIVGTLPYRADSAAYEAADRLKNPDSYEYQDPPAGCDHLSDYDPAEDYGSDDFD